MDEVLDFFDMTKPFQKKPLPVGLDNQKPRYLPLNDNDEEDGGNQMRSPANRKTHMGTEYVKNVVARERTKMDEVIMMPSSSSQAGLPPNQRQEVAASVMDELESLVSVCSMDSLNTLSRSKLDERMRDTIYDRYSFNRDHCSVNMPIHKCRKKILDAIQRNPVIVLQGDTGCGKTSQVPQFILEEAYERRQYCKIICTQPRRIAAISMAKRVSKERKWPEGTVVGYQVGLLRNVQQDTCITYCTNGVLMQKLVRDKSLNNFTHIILDEVHERNDDLDFLLIVIRRLLITNSKHVKIILMSATIDADSFSDYFRIQHRPAPIIVVDQMPLYNVKDFYLDDLSRITMNACMDLSSATISQEMYILAMKLLVVIDNIEKAEGNQQQLLDKTTSPSSSSASILVFLPGLYEIDEMCQKIEHLDQKSGSRTKFCPMRLHSLVPAEEQIKVFHSAPKGYRKLILATNIAESSITVPDVKYVIDFCLTKVQMVNSGTNFTSLQTTWASRTSCRQRAGRAGRVMNGRVYRLVTRAFYETQLKEYSTPEILCSPLDSLVLRSKLLDMGTPAEILGLAMSPPDLEDIHNTIRSLKEMGALYRLKEGRYILQDGNITFMGRIMAEMPIDIQLTRLILFGFMFSVSSEAIIIAAGLSVRSIFKYSINPNESSSSYIQKFLWADGSGSDLFAILKAYRVWISMREHNNMQSEENELAWAQRYSINLRSMKEMHLLVLELEERLKNCRLHASDLSTIHQHQQQQHRVHWLDREKTIVLKMIIAAAFYPNYFTRAKHNTERYERSIYQDLNGNDPTRTVFFSGFSTQHIRELYVPAIKKIFQQVRIPAKDIEVKFQPCSERVYVQFKDETINDDVATNVENIHTHRLLAPGRVQPNVYKALRMRVSKLPLTLNVIDYKSEIRFAEEHDIGRMVDGVWQPNLLPIKHIDDIVLPSLSQGRIKGNISHIDNCGKFYFLPMTEFESMQSIVRMLDMAEGEGLLQTFKNPLEIGLGMVVAAPWKNKYRRARVMRQPDKQLNVSNFQVLFLDIGSSENFDFKHLRKIDGFELAKQIVETPPRIFQCRLAKVQPATILSPNGKWTREAKSFMEHQLRFLSVVEMEIFSLVDCVANVFVYLESGKTMNDLLVERNLARQTEENYLSKIDHDMRVMKQNPGSWQSTTASSITNRRQEMHDYLLNNQQLRSNYLMAPISQIEDRLIGIFPPRTCGRRTITLRGPFSPMESNLLPANKISFWKSVLTERESVNSVLLNTDPQDTHERLLVAARITESSSGNGILARASTLMPNIPGFGPLMAMIFCPTMQIQCNADQTKYIGILTGLGYNNRTLCDSLFPEHDLYFSLDAEFDTTDFELINQLRYTMDTLLMSDTYNGRLLIMPQQCAVLKAKIKDLVIRLLSKNRNHIECTPTKEEYTCWRHCNAKELLGCKNILEESDVIFPMHSIPRLRNPQNSI